MFLPRRRPGPNFHRLDSANRHYDNRAKVQHWRGFWQQNGLRGAPVLDFDHLWRLFTTTGQPMLFVICYGVC